MVSKTVARRPVPERRLKVTEKRRFIDLDGGLFGAPGSFDTVLGIDQSTSGFAVTAMADQGAPIFHSWCTKLPGHGVFRLRAAQEFLYGVLEQLTEERRQVKYSVMEGYAFSRQMGHMLGELGGAVKLILAEYYGLAGPDSPGYPLIVPPSTLKKFTVGKGSGVAKQQMLLAIYKKWGVEFADDNMADSYALAMIGRCRDVERGLHAYELESLKVLRDPKHREVSV